jgi:hypothetical protein
MTTNVNRKYVWWVADETIDFKLKTLGSMETYRGEQHRLLGNKQWSHIDREPKFDGQKKANCVGLPGCKFCKEGHKATIEITGVPIEVDGDEFLTNLRKSQHDTITAEVDRLVMLNLDPFNYIFSLTKTSQPYPANWKITLAEIKKEKRDWSKEPKPTKKEKDAIAEILEQEKTLKKPSTDEHKIMGFTYLLGCPKERAEYLIEMLKKEKK